MRSLRWLGGATFITLAMAATASAHPVTGCVATFNGLTELCPKAEQNALGNDARARTDFGEVAATPTLDLLSTLPKQADFASAASHNSDLAFWGHYAVQGNYGGFQIIDVAEPATPRVVAHKSCPGSQNDVSVWRNLIVSSTDSQRNQAGCESTTSSQPTGAIWEGLRIFDWSNPADPQLIASVLTDCGSHTHTLVPDEAHGRLLVYVSSYGPGANLNCLPPHDKISIVEIPLDRPADAKVIAEPVLFPLLEGGGQTSTSGCHDITAYPAIGLSAGACMGEGIILDISDPAAPRKLSTVTDPNFSFWHSATFSDDGKKVIFTDELGGGSAARCTDAYGPDKGADAIYDISDPAHPVFKSYFKIPRFQNTTENCVAHNGALIPIPGRDVMVQSWYQGGTSIFDFTDASAPREIAYFDRGPIAEDKLVAGGHWSSYWYDGKIYANEMYRGLDVLDYSGDDAWITRQGHLNVQTQEPFADPVARTRKKSPRRARRR